MTWNDYTGSPSTYTPDSNTELSGGAELNGSQIDIDGTSGGFADDFSGTSFDARWDTAVEVSIDSGYASFTNNGSSSTIARLLATSYITQASVDLCCQTKVKWFGNAEPTFGFFEPTVNNFFGIFQIRTAFDYIRVRSGSIVLDTPVDFSNFEIESNVYEIFLKIEVKPDATAGAWQLIFYYSKNGIDYFSAGAARVSNGAAVDLGIGAYAANTLTSTAYSAQFDFVKVTGFEASSTAAIPITDSFTPDAPAKLSNFGPITVNLTGDKGANTSIDLEIQHNNDDLLFALQQINPGATKADSWSSLSDVAGEYTSFLDITSGSPIALPSFIPGPSEEFRARLIFNSDGVNKPQSWVSLVLPWQSDIIAPTNPILLSLTQDGGGAVVFQINEDLPADASAAELEVNINSVGFLPVAVNNKIESGSDYMKFIGSTSNVQKAGQVNALHYSLVNLSLGDTAQFRARFIDDVGNASAFTSSSVITISAAEVIKVPVENIDFEYSPVSIIFEIGNEIMECQQPFEISEPRYRGSTAPIRFTERSGNILVEDYSWSLTAQQEEITEGGAVLFTITGVASNADSTITFSPSQTEANSLESGKIVIFELTGTLAGETPIKRQATQNVLPAQTIVTP